MSPTLDIPDPAFVWFTPFANHVFLPSKYTSTLLRCTVGLCKLDSDANAAMSLPLVWAIAHPRLPWICSGSLHTGTCFNAHVVPRLDGLSAHLLITRLTAFALLPCHLSLRQG